MLPTHSTNRIYIAGPMTGILEFNFPAFDAAAEKLRSDGWEVVNPADHGVIEGAEWADYLRMDIPHLVRCGAIYLLPGWENSRGAQLEVHIAATLGLEFKTAPGATDPMYHIIAAKARPWAQLSPEGMAADMIGRAWKDLINFAAYHYECDIPASESDYDEARAPLHELLKHGFLTGDRTWDDMCAIVTGTVVVGDEATDGNEYFCPADTSYNALHVLVSRLKHNQEDMSMTDKEQMSRGVALPEALRQFQHNDGSGLTFGYDVVLVDAAIDAYQVAADIEARGAAALRERVAVLEAGNADLRQRVCVPDASAMARVLSDRVADARNIDLTDNWAMYGEEYIEDVQAMLAAAPQAELESRVTELEAQKVLGTYPKPSVLKDRNVTYSTSTQPSVPLDMRSTVREVFLRNGFTIKEGLNDLKPYVYDAAFDLLRTTQQAPARQVSEGWRELLRRASNILGSQGFEAWNSLASEIDAMLAAAPAPVERVEQETVGYESVHRVRQEAQMEAIRVRQAHEAARAADKARIAELESLLLEIRGECWSAIGGSGRLLLGDIAALGMRIDTALSQQGKENES